MRYAGALCILVIMIMVCGCSGLQNATPTPTITATDTPTPTPTATPLPTPVPTATPISLSGSGSHTTNTFPLESGISIFTTKYSGTDKFVVALIDQNGNTVDTVANLIGTYDGSRAIAITSDGDYALNIQATGAWSVDITQPRPTNADPAPISLSGTGPMASQFIYLNSGVTTFSVSHEGMNTFIIEVLDQNGRLVETAVNNIGSYRGSQSISLSQPGIYLLNIDADSTWHVDVSQ